MQTHKFADVRFVFDHKHARRHTLRFSHLILTSSNPHILKFPVIVLSSLFHDAVTTG